MAVGVITIIVCLVTLACPESQGCDIEEVHRLAQLSLMGGWRVADTNDARIQALKQKAVASNGVDEGLQVSEAYQQVVAGMNFCIRFGARGKCSGGLCQSFECVVAGHQPPSSDEFMLRNVTCSQQQSCDIEQISEHAKTPRPGGWVRNDDNSVHVDYLHELAAQLAAVWKGTLTRAFYQVVVGKNFCIEFETEGFKNCHADQCTPTKCVAGGFLPLSTGAGTTVAPSTIRKIGVQCDGRRLRMVGGAYSGAPSSCVNSLSFMTSLVAILAAILC